MISCLHHPIDNDPSLAELADLPKGWYAERAKLGEPWVRRKHEREEGPSEPNTRSGDAWNRSSQRRRKNYFYCRSVCGCAPAYGSTALV